MTRAMLWTLIDVPAMLTAGALTLLMLALLPMPARPREDWWTPAGWGSFTWAWANRWEQRLDSIAFDGISYWLRLRCGKHVGGNDHPSPSRWCVFIAWATQPPPGHLTR